MCGCFLTELLEITKKFIKCLAPENTYMAAIIIVVSMAFSAQSFLQCTSNTRCSTSQYFGYSDLFIC